jgi:hypothetical protein
VTTTALNVLPDFYWPVFRRPSLAGFGCPPRVYRTFQGLVTCAEGKPCRVHSEEARRGKFDLDGLFIGAEKAGEILARKAAEDPHVRVRPCGHKARLILSNIHGMSEYVCEICHVSPLDAKPPEPTPLWKNYDRAFQEFLDTCQAIANDTNRTPVGAALALQQVKLRHDALIKTVEREAEERGFKQGADDMVAIGLDAVEKARVGERGRIISWLRTQEGDRMDNAGEFQKRIKVVSLDALLAQLTTPKEE